MCRPFMGESCHNMLIYIFIIFQINTWKGSFSGSHWYLLILCFSTYCMSPLVFFAIPSISCLINISSRSLWNLAVRWVIFVHSKCESNHSFQAQTVVLSKHKDEHILYGVVVTGIKNSNEHSVCFVSTESFKLSETCIQHMHKTWERWRTFFLNKAENFHSVLTVEE